MALGWEYVKAEEFGLEGVAEISVYDNDWLVIAVYWHAISQSYRFYEGSGCSCDGPYEGIRNLVDFGKPLSYAEVRKEFQDVDRYDVTVADKIDAISDLAQFEAKRLGKNPAFFA